MGLDASVYCDCFEKGRLRIQPKPEWKVYIDDDGDRRTQAKELETQIEFDAWNDGACEHEHGRLVHHYLGNIALVSLFCRLLQAHATKLPIISTKVIYSGIHGGDRLSLADVEQLTQEIEYLAWIHDTDEVNEKLLRDFEVQLRDLARCSKLVQKPIVF